MKTISISYIVRLSGLFVLLSWGCKKETPKVIPTITASAITNITAISAISGGTVTTDGGAEVTSRGVCWSSTNSIPTISDTKTTDGSGLGNFSSSITGLTAGTTYNIRAYATNSVGTAFFSQTAFNTLALAPVLTTTDISTVTATSFNSGGNITSDGGSPITARGVCWSTSQNPTIAGSKTSDGNGTGSFTSFVTGVTPVTKYYIRAYATNGIETSYGNQVTFITMDYANCGLVADIEGNVYKTVTIGDQCWLRENLKTTKFRDGTAIPLVEDNTSWSNLTSPGYCWYNNDVTTYKNTYGGLYNWYTINTGLLCPTGWHVPTHPEWTTLSNNLGGELISGGKLKETGTSHWLSPNLNATNTSGFSAIPGGKRFSYDGSFFDIGNQGNWSSSSKCPGEAGLWYRSVYYNESNIGSNQSVFGYGFSVRCIKD